MAITRSQTGHSCPVVPKTIYWHSVDYETDIYLNIDIPMTPRLLTPMTPVNMLTEWPTIPAIPGGPMYWYSFTQSRVLATFSNIIW